jgi:1-pyrroline-5-carboxylate dehydrogenase
MEQTFTITKHTQLLGNWRKRFHHCSLSANPKQVATGCVVHLNFKVKMFSSFKILRTKSLWPAIKEQIITDVKSMKMGSPEDFSNFITAVIHEGSFDKLASFVTKLKMRC